jgi:hypothetical protein
MSDLGIIPAPADAGPYVELARSATGRVFRKHILNLGPLIHPKTGQPIQLDDAWYARLRDNFDSGVSMVQVPLANDKNEHSEDPLRNTGEVIGLEREGSKVYAVLDIRDPQVADKLGKTLLGASAMLHMDYTDTRTGQKVGPTLLHSCITNRPYVVGLGDYEEVVAATRAGYTEWDDGTATPPDLLMLCAPSGESLVLAGLADEADELELSPPDYLEHDERHPAMSYDDDIFRLGQRAAELSRHGGGQGSVTSAGARLNQAYTGAGHGYRPERNHAMVEYEHEMQRAEATALSATEAALEGFTEDDCIEFAGQIAARAGGQLMLHDVMDAAREMAEEMAAARGEPGEAREYRRIGAALLELSGHFEPGDEGVLELSRDAEADRLDYLYLARGRGESAHQPGDDPRVAAIVARNPSMLSSKATSGPFRVPTFVYDENEDLQTGTRHPRTGEVTTKTRAHSGPLGKWQPGQSGGTSTERDIARLQATHPEFFGRQEPPHSGNFSTPPKGPRQREAEERRARAGGRDQARISR